MILDNVESFPEMDPEGMLADIDALPDQLQAAWALGQKSPLPEGKAFRHVVVAGMGGSAIGGDMLRAYAASAASVPIIVWRNYGLPAFVQGPESLVIVSSHSGNTEEALSVFEEAKKAGASLIAVTTGGKLALRAGQADVACWIFEHSGQPRAAVGYSFGLLLAAVSRLGLIADPGQEMADAILQMRNQQQEIQAPVPIVENSAKRIAGQLMGRLPIILAADHLVPVARRWTTQINELAKAVAQYNELPEADHNMIAGVNNPETLFGSTMVLFLRSAGFHPRNLQRTDLTKQVMMIEGFSTGFIDVCGDTRLAQQWTALHFGDYVAYYLAISYMENPTPVPVLEEFKRRMIENQAEH